MDWQGRSVLVTGSAGGFGLELARRFVARGARVWVSDVDEVGVRAVAEQLGTPGVVLDVTDEAAFGRVVDDIVAEHGRLDVLVNNAAVDLTAEVARLCPERWQQVLDVNLGGVVNGVHHAYRHMVRQRGGLIVNVGSGAGLLGFPTSAPYTASKGAVIALTRALRAEAEVYGVRVALVFPGKMQTRIQAREGLGIDRPAFLQRLPGAWITAERSARIAVDALERGRDEITTQWSNRVGAWLYTVFPGLARSIRRRVVRELHRVVASPPPGGPR